MIPVRRIPGTASSSSSMFSPPVYREPDQTGLARSEDAEVMIAALQLQTAAAVTWLENRTEEHEMVIDGNISTGSGFFSRRTLRISLVIQTK